MGRCRLLTSTHQQRQELVLSMCRLIRGILGTWQNNWRMRLLALLLLSDGCLLILRSLPTNPACR
jgi:hypothetical protein